MALNYGGDNRGTETGHVIKALTLKEKSFPRRRPYASGVGFCSTQTWFHANRPEGEYVLSPSLNLFQGVGNGVEDRIVEGFEAHKLLLGKQVKLPNPPPTYKIDVGGYIDLVALNSLGEVGAYEVKTCSSLPQEPKIAHFSQAMTYACLGGFDNVYIVYVARNVQNFPDPTPLVKVFSIDVQENVLEYMRRIVLSCHHMHDKTAPQRPAHFRKSKECLFCDFQAQCWNVTGFEFKDYSESLIDEGAAEKIALELIEQRPSFFATSLSNAKGGAPKYAIEIIDGVLGKINTTKVKKVRLKENS